MKNDGKIKRLRASKRDSASASSMNKRESDFVTATSHQFRTPLSTIQTSLDLLEFYIGNGNESRQIEILRKLKKSVGYLTDTVEKITSLYLYRSAKLKPKIRKVDLRNFVNDLLEEIVINIGDSHYINVGIEAGLDTIECDEFILKQILLNLLNNAIKYSPGGGQIRLDIKKEKKKLKFSVKDEGVGISKGDLDKLFHPFFRGRNAVSIPGIGLGLAIVKNLAKIHKASLGCFSRINQGSEFVIIIPAEYKNEKNPDYRR